MGYFHFDYEDNKEPLLPTEEENKELTSFFENTGEEGSLLFEKIKKVAASKSQKEMTREERYKVSFDNGIEVETKTYTPETIIGVNVDKNSFEKLKKIAKEELGVDLIKDEDKKSYSFEELFPFKPLVPADTSRTIPCFVYIGELEKKEDLPKKDMKIGDVYSVGKTFLTYTGIGWEDMNVIDKDSIDSLNKRIEAFKELRSLMILEPDCSRCKHYRFGEDGRDITCHDCKWNYNDMFEEKE